MQVITTIQQMRNYSNEQRSKGKIVGFVPTMGALHKGHISLIEAARCECDVVIISIFVNPKQFCPGEDYLEYPRTSQHDKEIASSKKVDIIFYPSIEEMYKEPYLTYVNVNNLSDILCGRYRKGHFMGVATVICKLFNIINPHKAYFGEKDYQQAVIIKQLVKDLNYDIDIKVLPTVRDENGLALSSRNSYLSESDLKKAASIYKALSGAKNMLEEGIKSAEIIKDKINSILKAQGLFPQYIEVCDPDTLEELKEVDTKAVICVATYIGNTRLIDNIVWRM